MNTRQWKPVLYRRNARGEEFLQIPRGFWAPLARLLDAPHLAGAATTLLKAGLPGRFAVRGDRPGHVQDAAARLLPLILYRQAMDLEPLVRRCADPHVLRDYVEEHLAAFPPTGDTVTERQVLVCQALPDGAGQPLQPALPEDCPFPVLIQPCSSGSLPGGLENALEHAGGPVILLLTGDVPAPEGWPEVTIPAASDTWYGELLFHLCYRSSCDCMDRRDAHLAAEGLLQRYHHNLTEQDFALAASYVRRRQGPDGRTTAAYFLQLAAQIPRGTLPCCPAGTGQVLFRQSQLSDTLTLAIPVMAVAAWKYCAHIMPQPYPHGEAPSLPHGLPDGWEVHNRMLYVPPESLDLHAPCTLLVAEDRGGWEEFFGRRLHDIHSYADLAGAAADLAGHRPGVRCWMLVLNCAPEDLQKEDICRAPYAFYAEEDSLTLYDGPEGLQAFARAAGDLMMRQLHRETGKKSR